MKRAVNQATDKVLQAGALPRRLDFALWPVSQRKVWVATHVVVDVRHWVDGAGAGARHLLLAPKAGYGVR